MMESMRSNGVARKNLVDPERHRGLDAPAETRGGLVRWMVLLNGAFHCRTTSIGNSLHQQDFSRSIQSRTYLPGHPGPRRHFEKSSHPRHSSSLCPCRAGRLTLG